MALMSPVCQAQSGATLVLQMRAGTPLTVVGTAITASCSPPQVPCVPSAVVRYAMPASSDSATPHPLASTLGSQAVTPPEARSMEAKLYRGRPPRWVYSPPTYKRLSAPTLSERTRAVDTEL